MQHQEKISVHTCWCMNSVWFYRAAFWKEYGTLRILWSVYSFTHFLFLKQNYFKLHTLLLFIIYFRYGTTVIWMADRRHFYVQTVQFSAKLPLLVTGGITWDAPVQHNNMYWMRGYTNTFCPFLLNFQKTILAL